MLVTVNQYKLGLVTDGCRAQCQAWHMCSYHTHGMSARRFRPNAGLTRRVLGLHILPTELQNKDAEHHLHLC